MSWNYRIVKYRKPGNGWTHGLHEVYYDNKNRAWGMTEVPETLNGMSGREITGMLALALADARKHPLFVEPKRWPGTSPSSGLKRWPLKRKKKT